MSVEMMSDYMSQIEKAPSDYARRELLLKAARDQNLTTPEFIRLDNWAKRWMNERKGKGK